MEGTASEELLALYLFAGRPVVALSSHPAEGIPGQLARIGRHPDRSTLLDAIESLEGHRAAQPAKEDLDAECGIVSEPSRSGACCSASPCWWPRAAASAQRSEGGGKPPVRLDVSLSEFSISPSTIHAPTGTPLKFEITNDGKSSHTFAVDTGSGAVQTPQIAAGTSTALSVPSMKATTCIARSPVIATWGCRRPCWWRGIPCPPRPAPWTLRLACR